MFRLSKLLYEISELETLKAAQSSSGSDEVTPQRPRKKKVPRALTVSSLFTNYYYLRVTINFY